VKPRTPGWVAPEGEEVRELLEHYKG
jgi:hypothetical protein